ncbi:hypothetical protein [Erythrobacter rubeus]|uniref:Cytochrome c domain-containing protein n=1 Tax=Erythrobacter rubeus TaxID=2760803 RepID=A0ABR8KY49_9SPHN|nr:hypothetical protein [Erythrobacter rubeus]MBD2843146.1 hypothetical protein [Erythrobacter rubeus]
MKKAPIIPLAAPPVLLAAFLSACQTTGPASQVSAESEPPAFVEAACGGCHAVEPPFLSPNPASPTFEAIANNPGVTDETLASWLTDAHNYPEEMDFDLEPEQIEMIAEYLVTLRRDDYEPAQ